MADTASPAASTPRELERIAIDLVVEAGRFIVEERPRDLSVSRTKSSATDVVTVMDQRCQDLLRESLARLRPTDGFYGEEEGGTPSQSGITWVVDPIDGTVNYLYAIPAYAVSVAAVVGDPGTPGGWRPVAGAVMDPVCGDLFHASEDGGAFRVQNGTSPEQLSIGEPESLALALVGTGFGYDAQLRAWQGRTLLDLLPKVRDIRRMGSAALDLCHVADGRLDVYYESGLNPWDMAAAWLVISEAGGLVTGLDGGAPLKEMVVAGGPMLQPQLRALVASALSAAGEHP